MSYRSFLILTVAASCFGLGCNSREKELPGTWSSSGMTLHVTADHKWTFPLNAAVLIGGTWSFDGKDATFLPDNVNGKSMAEAKKKMLSSASRFGTMASYITKFANDIDKPNVFTLADDGKSMTTDKAKDTNSGPAQTLTKSS